ncbi:MAG: NUDIX domain-containing protein [Clostridiales bacterium]|nr:NUDIX domain-containing protein [Clostridiales bacterium]
MLGKYVRVRVSNQIYSVNRQFGFTYELNFGIIESKNRFDNTHYGAYIMGVHHPVRSFDGRIIAAIKRSDGSPVVYIVAPKNMKFISYQINEAIAFAEGSRDYTLDCLYERSCGAVVYRIINNEVRYLLIKNKRASHWGFPKGHMEKGETPEQTAAREVLEETGIHIGILPGFAYKSEYTIKGKVEKAVTIFLACTQDVQTIIQQEEIEDYLWLNYSKAMNTLRFVNDKNILKNAKEYLENHGVI